ncbi:VOC family protein [Amorphus sp. 3PC139-8]|uniref:VOC family protein n=1 Tax=Amorphus sp. 3PC139-8 TaxID=2735676 RepID=UPI00345C7029
MSDAFLDIDHLMVHVPDSERAGAAFERLGFVATPKSEMPGLSNRLICFSDTTADSGVCNYIELMELEDAAIAPPQMQKVLLGPGPASTVLSVEDAAAVRERLAEEGMTISPALELSRDWILPNGEVLKAAFAVAIPEPGQAPFYWNFCKHRTAQHYVRPDFTGHPNGALRISQMIAVAEDPADTAAHYVTHWQARFEGGRLVLPHGRVTLALLNPADYRAAVAGVPGLDARPGLKGIRIAVSDLAGAQRLIEAAGVSTYAVGDGFAVAPVDAAGTLLIFEGPDAARE